MRRPFYSYALIIFIIALFKLWLVSAIAIIAQTWAGHDDRLFINLAHSIIQHHWLGDYDQYTLIKGPGFPLWLACLYWLRIPLLLGNEIIFIIAAIMFSWAIKQITGNYKLAIFCYLVLVLNIDMNNRVVREGFYTPLTLLIFALITLQITYLKTKHKLSVLGIVLFSLLFFWFWIIREEGVWIIPSLMVCLCLIIFLIIRNHQTKIYKNKQLYLLTIPFIMLFLGLKTVACINGNAYQSWSIVELKSPEFMRAYGSLSRVITDTPKRFVPVAKASRVEIYKISPAYREISHYLDRLNKWQSDCRNHSERCNEITSGWFIWALRDAVASIGYYKTGAAASEYYQRLKNEIAAACQQKLLNCFDERNTLRPIISSKDVIFILSSFLKGIVELVNPIFYQSDAIQTILVEYGSTGDRLAMDYFSHILHDAIAPLEYSTQHQIYVQKMQDNLQIKILVKLSGLYGLLFKTALFAAFIYFIYQIYLILQERTINVLWVINASIVIAIVARLLILAVIDATSFPAINPVYLEPLYPLCILFILLNIVIFHQRIINSID